MPKLRDKIPGGTVLAMLGLILAVATILGVIAVAVFWVIYEFAGRIEL